MTNPKHPCYDETTNTDCPRRKAGCAATCPEWAAYDKQRRKIYDARKTAGLATAAADSVIFNHRTKAAKKAIRRNRYKSNKPR